MVRTGGFSYLTYVKFHVPFFQEFCSANHSNKTMHWTYLFLAGLFEIGWTIGLKQMDNHKNGLWTIVFYISLVTSFYMLQQAMKAIPMGTAYAVYTGIGATGTVVIGMLFLNEPVSLLRIGFLLLILFGVVGLKIA